VLLISQWLDGAMARTQTVFVCSACGGESPKWQGQCPACTEWNSLSRLTGVAGPSVLRPTAPAAVGQSLTGSAAARFTLGLGELDRVVGGGMTGGSVCLLGGEPGIGKSTLLLQVAAAVSAERPVLYASGEESVAQTTLRAQRLGLVPEKLGVLSSSALEQILALATDRGAQLLLIDSIQTMQSEALDGAPGSLAQLRECTAALVRFAKSSATAIIIVGHVTKDGAIAGPKLLEHLVDTVLYFESDAASRFRILRATKNRFGAANELGFFAMGEIGLQEVKNPSAIFLSRHAEPVPGSLVMVARDGGRALLIEVQALVDHARAAMPRRVAQGVDTNRLSMLLAVMSRHAGVALADFDVFVNLVGGLQISETATDLPLALALVSSLRSVALPMDLVVFGELGLTGEVRPVAHGEERMRELAKQGYRRVILPRQNMPRGHAPEGVQLVPVTSLAAAVEAALQS
jgi:DNA repair protein RadA/Sms